jgi:hypothetical protein
MKRKITLEQEQVKATLGDLQNYLDDAGGHGAPDTAKVRIDTTPDGISLMVTVEYEEEVGALPSATS